MLFVLPSNASAESSRGSAVPIQFAILLEDSDPVHGEALCALDKTCVVLDRDDPTLRISIKMSGREDRASEIKVFCSTLCSFKNRHSTMAFSSESQFTFFEGEEMGEVPLVLKA
ncbi:hypothetical protein GOZ89_15820 [Agrobacterium vitis]|uniref:hypothetical protein n=1 Tax=Agrobacterium vitis TaxID=373 RepID=UPI0012E706C5|nr:hypothetical protein [Agrobacterium vitis]MVA80893.1 hypothetical protein [Agrobacterium vitis]